jgi:SAM-dependent methyltransferase
MKSQTIDSESSWGQRLSKARKYLGRSDLSGLIDEIRRFFIWKQNEKSRRRVSHICSESEAVYWDEFDADICRKVSWGGAAQGILGQWASEKMCDGRYSDIIDLISNAITIPRTEPLRGLVLGCGDMAGEHTAFANPKLPFAEVDAYDISPQSVERARRLTDQKGLKVNYHLANVNQVELAHNRYALIVIFHSYHHFEQVDHVAQQINRALLPGGIFYTLDYIGPCRLQFSERQLHYAQRILQLLPTRYRRQLDGTVRQSIQRVSPEALSPDEAICSDQILPAIAQHMNIVQQYNWAGLLYPLLEGLAFNFTVCDEDRALLKLLFDLDYALCQAGEVEPNFTITLAAKQ